MELYFIRHAIAVDVTDPSIHHDAERGLTREGIEKMERAVQGLRIIQPDLDAIFTSPYRRARQTAEILARAYELERGWKEAEEFCPGADLNALRHVIRHQPENARIALVGHEPDLSGMIARLVCGNPARIEMKKGAVCRVDVSEKILPGSGTLVWLLPPAILRKIAS